MATVKTNKGLGLNQKQRLQRNCLSHKLVALARQKKAGQKVTKLQELTSRGRFFRQPEGCGLL